MSAAPETADALARAGRLINWMMSYVGKMAPGDYHDCYAELNEHCLFMERRARLAKVEGRS